MPLRVLLRDPHVTLQRHKRSLSMIVCPKVRRWGLLPSLSLMFLSIVIASVGFFAITGVKFTQRVQFESKLLSKGTREMPFFNHIPSTPSYTNQGGFFKIHPLLNKSAPSVELSAQIILNRLYSIYNRDDVLNYYNWVRCKEGMECKKFTIVSKSENRTRWASMRFCRTYPTRLRGPLKVTGGILIKNMTKEITRSIRFGGWWEPEECLARHSVAIVIPYKDRRKHLTTLLNNLHPFLQRQELRYKLFVVEQYGDEIFNKGMIMNAAFLEALKEELFHCFIFHDVDLIPENDYNMYTCPDMPRHLSVAVNEFNYRLPYAVLVGGVFAIRTDHFFRVNGYSNFYWGWGGEDDDMGFRVLQSGLKITRPLPGIGRYTMIKHVKRKPSDPQIRKRLLATARKRFRLDGLNSIQYTLINKNSQPWFTKFLVDIGKPHPSFIQRWNLVNSTKVKAFKPVPKVP